MRPLRLTIRGLRSYRGECTIDFRDRGLIAIVGDTGAGKSSILEAITYALYNATTWDQRAVSQLISDGAQSMSVELEFQAGDQVWQVHRAYHRAAGRPSTHRLRCLSDSAAEDCDGEAAVNRQVERLLGMSYRAYHAAVVLPQGRFQTLLQETRARRTEILEGIFRLTDLRSVRTAARDFTQRADVAVGLLMEGRKALLPDPAASAKALAAELALARQRESVLSELQAEVARTRDAVREATRRSAALREHARHVARADGGVARRLADLLPLSAAIQSEMAEAGDLQEETRQREEAAAATAAGAAEVGESVEDLAAAVPLLEGVRQALADLEVAASSVEREQVELDADTAALAAAEALLPELEARSEAARQAAAAATDALDKHQELRRQVAEVLRAARGVAGSSSAAAAAEQQRRGALPDLEQQLAQHQRLVHEAESALEVRQSAYGEAQRRDAAAHAAQGLVPGDLCPVCGRQLAEAFQPPSTAALRPLQREVKDAEVALARCRSDETTAANHLDEAGRRLTEAVSQREAAEDAAREQLDALRLLLPGADVAVDDATLLAPVDERGRDLATSAASRVEEAEQARDRLRDARADVEARREGNDWRATRLERERSRIRDQRARCRIQLDTLPPAFAVEEVAGASELDPVIAAAAHWLDSAKSQRRELDALRAEVARLAQVRASLQRRLQDEVEVPRSSSMQRAAELLLRVTDGLEALGSPPLEGAPSGATIEAEVRWAEELDRRADQLRQRLEEEIAATERTAAAAMTDLSRRLAEHSMADGDGVDAELRLLGRQLGKLQGDLEAAEAQIPQAAGLDGRIAAGIEIRDSLSELARLLQDSQFVGHVIDRRQRELLVVASQILGSMTAGAYGFSSEFDIVDRFTNQPRPTRTLSGGETFLASLALALALVEIAGRSGNRLDALFLDEGFGSLDASALDDALSALEHRASHGRLVAVVSHVRAVAERIETVLEVTRSPTGSRAEWRGAAERELMLADELEARLLA